MKQPFLTIVTRSYKKPKCLQKCIESVEAQTDPDYEQIFIIDEVGRGLAWADQALAENAHKCNGKYVMVLDDDDYILTPNFIKLIKHTTARRDPDIIIWRGQFVDANMTLPGRDHLWGVKPIITQIGSFNYCARNHLYKEHIHTCKTGKTGDFDYIDTLFKLKPKPTHYWINKVLVSTQQKSFGTDIDRKD